MGDVAALKRGEPRALDAFYREHAGKVLNWVIRLGGPWLDPHDVSHDVFEVALRRLHTLREGTSETAWLYGVTRRVVANARRRAAFRRFLGLGDRAIPDPRHDGDALLNTLHQRRRVQLLLEQLGAIHREVLVLVDIEERSAPEVAELLDLSVGTVYSRLHHARRKLKAVLEKERAEGDAASLVGVLRGKAP